MIHFDRIEPQTPSWLAWQANARKATDKLLAAHAQGKAIAISSKRYKAEKKQLLERFFGKCSYCEVDLGRHHGDIEHYRPKKGVTDINNDPVVVSVNGQTKAHPGYFWLAYAADNLLLACNKCNQQPIKKPDGTLAGKGNRFPISTKGVRAAKHDDNPEAEAALLLHPVFDHPERHLTYNEATGALGYLDDRGRATIEVLDLNNEWLLEQRKKTYQAVQRAYIAALPYIFAKQMALAKVDLDLIDQHKTGKAPFAFAGRRAIEAIKEGIRAAGIS